MGDSDHVTPSSRALPADTRLNRKYTIKNILGSGGFGITYRGVEDETGVPVAVKEYFPHRLALRTQEQGRLSVAPFSEKYRQEFEEGRRHFLDEAKILRELEYLDNIVSVFDCFEANGTAYIVMEYIEGVTLEEVVQTNGTLSFPEMTALFSPLMPSLWEMHQRGLVHRDISPGNLILGTDSRLHLIDFGAAKLIPQDGDANTMILKVGYAPPELYIPNGKIGPWTDIYSLCATMYFALTGASPVEAIQRLEQGDDGTLPGMENLLPGQSAVLKKGLALRTANRFASVMKLKEALLGLSAPGQEETIMETAFSREREKKLRRFNRRQKKWRYILIPVLGVTVVLLILGRLGGSLFPDAVRREVSISEPTGGLQTPAVEGSFASGVPEKTSSPAILQTPEKGAVLSMISVRNMKLKKAKNVLKKLDPSIEVSTVYVYHEKIAAGRIVQQSVAGNTLFTRGNLPLMLLTVSKGKEKKSVAAPAKKTPAPTARRSKEKPSDFQIKPEDGYTDFTLD